MVLQLLKIILMSCINPAICHEKDISALAITINDFSDLDISLRTFYN